MFEKFEYFLTMHPVFYAFLILGAFALILTAVVFLLRGWRYAHARRILKKIVLRNRDVMVFAKKHFWRSGRKHPAPELFMRLQDTVYAIKVIGFSQLSARIVMSAEWEWMREVKYFMQKQVSGERAYRTIRLPHYDFTKGLPAAWASCEVIPAYVFSPIPQGITRFSDRPGAIYPLETVFGKLILYPESIEELRRHPDACKKTKHRFDD